jgi:hypothetical protein
VHPIEEANAFVETNGSVAREKWSPFDTTCSLSQPKWKSIETKEQGGDEKEQSIAEKWRSVEIDCYFVSIECSFASIARHFVAIVRQVASIASTFVREEAFPRGEHGSPWDEHRSSFASNNRPRPKKGESVMSNTNKTTTTSRSIAVLKLPTKVLALINLAQAIAKALTNNPHFPDPTPTLAAIVAAIAALVTSQNACLTRVKGAVVQRNAAKKALVQLLELLRANIQSTADADPDNALAIIESAGIGVRKTAVRAPRVFAATQGAVSGSAKLVAPSAGPRSSYEWEVSTDGGKTWVTAPPSVQAKTTLQGLASGTTVQFRYRAVTPKAGAGNWSAPASLLVQ